MKAARFLAVSCFLFLTCSALLSDEIYLWFSSRRSFSHYFSSSLADLNAELFQFFSEFPDFVLPTVGLELWHITLFLLLNYSETFFANYVD